MMNEQIVPFGAWLSNTILSANTDNESYQQGGGGMLRKASTGWRKEETRQELEGFAGVEGWGMRE